MKLKEGLITKAQIKAWFCVPNDYQYYKIKDKLVGEQRGFERRDATVLDGYCGYEYANKNT